MKCLSTIADISIIGGKIEVFLLKSTDFFQHSLCFIGDDVCVLNYTTVDIRGPISVLVPTTNVTIQWNTKAVVTISDEIVKSQWASSTPLATISDVTFHQYQEWLLEWLIKHRIYSILEGENTNKLFVLDSLRYLLKRADKVSPLILIDTCTYQIAYENKERVASVVQRRELMEYYNLLSGEGTLQRVVNLINRLEQGYYHDNTTGNSVYWLMEGYKLEAHYEKIDLDHTKRKNKQSLLDASSRKEPLAMSMSTSATTTAPNTALSVLSAALGVSPPSVNAPPPITASIPITTNSNGSTPTLPLGSTGVGQQLGQTPVTPLAPATIVPVTAPLSQSRTGLLLVAVLIAIMIIIIVVIVIIVASYSTPTTPVIVPVASPPPSIVVV